MKNVTLEYIKRLKSLEYTDNLGRGMNSIPLDQAMSVLMNFEVAILNQIDNEKNTNDRSYNTPGRI